jgi:uncharacterized protein YbaP (TraB family)
MEMRITASITVTMRLGMCLALACLCGLARAADSGATDSRAVANGGAANNGAVNPGAVVPAAGSAAPSDMDEVVVGGEQPGPGLWKVSRGDHVLWVLGTVGVLPKHMKWKSQEIERVLASSQVMLSRPGATPDANIGFFSALALVPAFFGIEKLPDGGTLQSVLPQPLYARWTVQRQKYIGDSRSLERLRPFIAADKLTDKAYDRAGLTDNEEVLSTVRKLAKKYHLKRIDAEYHFLVKDPKAAINTFKKASMDESACFSYELDELERSLEQAKERANAWATGDVGALRASTRNNDDPCVEMFTGTALVKQLGVEDIDNKVNVTWVDAAEKVLAENQQSFTLLGMRDLMLPDGVLAMLKTRGYSVVEPDQGSGGG